MARIYNIEMSTRQRDLVISMVRCLVDRLRHQTDPRITYKELAEQIGTNYHKLGQPLILMADVLHQCHIVQNIPSLNALVVYSSNHLPCADGLNNAEGLHIHNNAELMDAMSRMNAQAMEFQDWEAVIADIVANCFE